MADYRGSAELPKGSYQISLDSEDIGSDLKEFLKNAVC